MKAVVTEIRGGLAAVLSEDGRMVKVKNQNYAIGQVIQMKETTTAKRRLLPAVAAAALVAVLGGVSAYAYYTPYSYVSLDVNPSIEYSLNRFDRVLRVTGVNDDGEEILKELHLENLSNKKIDEAIALTVKEMAEEGYLEDGTEGGIVIATSAKDLKKAEQLALKLERSAEDAADKDGITVDAIPVGQERVEEARELGVTPGKLNLVEKLQESAEDPDEIDLEEWLDKPVKEIQQEIKQNRKEQKEERKEEKDDKGKKENNPSSKPSDNSEPTSSASKVENKLDKVEEKQNSLAEKETGNVEKQQQQAQEKIEKTESKAQEKQERQEEKDAAKAEKQENKPSKPEKK